MNNGPLKHRRTSELTNDFKYFKAANELLFINIIIIRAIRSSNMQWTDYENDLSKLSVFIISHAVKLV